MDEKEKLLLSCLSSNQTIILSVMFAKFEKKKYCTSSYQSVSTSIVL